MALKNPNFKFVGIDIINNKYEIVKRNILYPNYDINSLTVDVAIKLVAFNLVDEKEVLIKDTLKDFPLFDLPNDPSKLNPNLYEEELIKQHGDQMVDGTLLKDFIVIK